MLIRSRSLRTLHVREFVGAFIVAFRREPYRMAAPIAFFWCILLLACMGLSETKYVALKRAKADGKLQGFVGGFRGAWARLYQRLIFPRLPLPPGELFIDALWGVVPGAPVSVAVELMDESFRVEELRIGATTVMTTVKGSGGQRVIDWMARHLDLPIARLEVGNRCAYFRHCGLQLPPSQTQQADRKTVESVAPLPRA